MKIAIIAAAAFFLIIINSAHAEDKDYLADLEKLRIIEASPLVDADEEAFLLDGEIWVRERDDYRFHKVKTTTRIGEEINSSQDLSFASTDRTKYDVVIFADTPEKYKIALDLQLSLESENQEGFYRTSTTKQNLNILSSRNIEVYNYANFIRNEKPEELREIPQKNDGSLLLDTQDLIFSENFEGIWPGDWDVGDLDSYSGLDYWGDVYCEDHNGYWSCWCADEGDMTDCDQYDNDMDAFISSPGIDVSSYEDVQLNYFVKYDMEPGYDSLFRYYSSDGINWTASSSDRFGGSSGWTNRVFNLNNFSTYYVRWVFYSDYSINWYEGAYLDDIQITGSPVSNEYSISGQLKYNYSLGGCIGGVQVCTNTGLCAWTDDQGEYTIENVPPGSYTVSVQSNSDFDTGDWNWSPGSSRPVTVSNGNVYNIDFTASCRGVAYLTDPEGIPDYYETGVPFDVTFGMVNTGSTVDEAHVYLSVTFPDAAQVNVINYASGFDVTQYPPGSTIFHAPSSGNECGYTFSSSHRLVDGHRAGIYYNNYNQAWMTLRITPQTSGSVFRIQYKASIGDRHDPTSGPVNQQGWYVEQINIPFQPEYSISGQLTYSSSYHGCIEGVEVCTNTGLCDWTDANGEYTIENVPPATYTVSVQSTSDFDTGDWTWSPSLNRTVTVSDGNVNNIDFAAHCRGVPNLASPEGVPSYFEQGVPFDVTFGMTNTGSTVDEANVYLSVTLPDEASVTVLNYASGFDITQYPPGSEIFHAPDAGHECGFRFNSSYLLIDGHRAGIMAGNSDQAWMTLRITPLTSGSLFRIQYLASIGDRNDPTSGPVNQQGWWCYEEIIGLNEPDINITPTELTFLGSRVSTSFAEDYYVKPVKKLPEFGFPHIPNEFIIKIDHNIGIPFDLDSHNYKTGIHEIDSLTSLFEINNIRNVFTKRNDSPLLKNTLILKINNKLELRKVVDAFLILDIIDYVDLNYILPTREVPNDPSYSNQWALPHISAPEAWDITHGSASVPIAIVDTGVDWDHPDLDADIWINNSEIPDNGIDDDNNGFVDDIRGWDFLSNAQNPAPAPGEDSGVRDNDPMDFQGHGTHCAGIASAVTDNSIGVAGVGWDCTIMAVRAGYEAVDGNGYVVFADAADGIVYAAENGAKAINLSFGSSGAGNTLVNAVQFGFNRGAVACYAAGNSNQDNPGTLGNLNTTLAVANTNSNDVKAPLSNFGSWIDISAPGQNIISTYFDNTYANLYGTSMAAPHVAGLAGLIYSLNSGLTPSDVMTYIKDNTDNIDAQNPSYVGMLGTGRINAYQTIQAIPAGENVFTISNEGTGLLLVTDIRKQNPSASWYSFSPNAPFELAQEENQPVTITIHEENASPGINTDRIIVESNDPDESPYPNGVYINLYMPLAISGNIQSGGEGIEDVELYFSGLGSVYTNQNGDYEKLVPYGWSGTVNPMHDCYSFSPQDRNYSNVTTPQTGQNYVGIEDIVLISGTVTDGSGSGISGVTMTGLPGSPETNNSGYYSAEVSCGWSGTVTPFHECYTFNPTYREYNYVIAPQSNQNYVGTENVVLISGRVIDNSGQGVPDVVMTGLPCTPTPITDPNGDYSCQVSCGWSGTVTPTNICYTFSPQNRIYDYVTLPQTNQDYIATEIEIPISGQVTNNSGQGIADVVLDGFPCIPAPVTDLDGNYTCDVVCDWSGTVTPTKDGFTFSPPNREYNNVTSPQQNQDYLGSEIVLPLAGTVIDDTGLGLPDVLMDGLPCSPTPVTDSDGNYSCDVPYGWSGIVTPAKECYSFTPPFRNYDNVISPQSNQDYTATLTGLPIGGFMASPDSGCINLEVAFTDTSLNNPTEWNWDFGDGQNSIEQNPVHVYDSVGVFTVTLIAINVCGEDTIIQNDLIIVDGPPTGTISNIIASDDSCATIYINWEWNYQWENGFHIYRNSFLIDSVEQTITSYIDDSIDSTNQWYSYQVSAFNHCGNGPLSDTVWGIAHGSVEFYNPEDIGFINIDQNPFIDSVFWYWGYEEILINEFVLHKIYENDSTWVFCAVAPYMQDSLNYFYINSDTARVYDYRVCSVSACDTSEWIYTGILGATSELPEEYYLSQSYPNPFNAQTSIEFGLPYDSYVRLEIFDLLGKKVEVLIDKKISAGYHKIIWNSRNIPSGVYFYRICANNYSETRKMLLLK